MLVVEDEAEVAVSCGVGVEESSWSCELVEVDVDIEVGQGEEPLPPLEGFPERWVEARAVVLSLSGVGPVVYGPEVCSADLAEEGGGGEVESSRELLCFTRCELIPFEGCIEFAYPLLSLCWVWAEVDAFLPYGDQDAEDGECC